MNKAKKSKVRGDTLATLIETNRFMYASSPALYVCYMLLSIFEVAGIAVSLLSVQFTTNAIYRVFNGTSAGLRYEITGILLFGLASLVVYLFETAKQLALKKIKLDATYRFEKTTCAKLGSVQWDVLEEHETSV